MNHEGASPLKAARVFHLSRVRQRRSGLPPAAARSSHGRDPRFGVRGGAPGSPELALYKLPRAHTLELPEGAGAPKRLLLENNARAERAGAGEEGEGSSDSFALVIQRVTAPPPRARRNRAWLPQLRRTCVLRARESESEIKSERLNVHGPAHFRLNVYSACFNGLTLQNRARDGTRPWAARASAPRTAPNAQKPSGISSDLHA